MTDPDIIVHLVMLDEELRTAFVTRDAGRADEARRVLAEAFGRDRVSVMRYGESTIDDYETAVALWKRHPELEAGP